MINVRRNVFETNSSSVHSICIAKGEPIIPSKIYFDLGEYGWEYDEHTLPSYLYTAIALIYSGAERDEKVQQLKDILDAHNIEYEFQDYKDKEEDYDFYIDHGYELKDFVDKALSDEDLLLRCLSNTSCVYTGNDNSGGLTNMCYAALESFHDYMNNKDEPNLNHHPDEYDYFYKGN